MIYYNTLNIISAGTFVYSMNTLLGVAGLYGGIKLYKSPNVGANAAIRVTEIKAISIIRRENYSWIFLSQLKKEESLLTSSPKFNNVTDGSVPFKRIGKGTHGGIYILMSIIHQEI